MNEFCLKQVQGLKTSAAHLNPNFPHCPPPPPTGCINNRPAISQANSV